MALHHQSRLLLSKRISITPLSLTIDAPFSNNPDCGLDPTLISGFSSEKYIGLSLNNNSPESTYHLIFQTSWNQSAVRRNLSSVIVCYSLVTYQTHG